MSRIETMQGLEAALELLREKRMELCGSGNAAYRMVAHAWDHVDAQLNAMLRGQD